MIQKLPLAAPITKPQADFSAWGRAAFEEKTDQPLCLYVHIPFCRHRCSFCPFYINRCNEGFSGEYTDNILTEIQITSEVLGRARKSRQVSAVYFGGGTPSDLMTEDLISILNTLKENFEITASTEITVEGRIRGFTQKKAELLVGAGVNRFSLGLQSSSSKIRKRLGRLASQEEIAEVLHGIGMTQALLIVDLIYGLPGQHLGSLAEDVRFLSQQTPIDGLDLYQLRQFPGSPLERALKEKRLPAAPDQDLCSQLLEEAEAQLIRFNFEPFSPRHWRRNPRERSLYNTLAKSNSDILAFGSAAGGRLGAFTVSLNRDLPLYRRDLLAGRKPLV